MRESEIEAYLVRCVEAAGGEVRKLKWIGRRGAPDRVVMLPHCLTFVELKAPGKKPTAQQRREHERMKRMGIPVRVLDSHEAVDNYLVAAITASRMATLAFGRAEGEA